MERTKIKSKNDILVKEEDRDEVEELKAKLLPRQIAFCHSYIRDYNGSRAAREAGYNPRNAENAGWKLLKKTEVKRYIELIKKDIEKEVGISKVQLINELKTIALSDVSEIYCDWITQENFDKLRKNNPKVLKAIQEISTKVETALNASKELVEVHYVKIKFYDKQRAIEAIFKAMGWNEPDNVNIFMEQPLFGKR
jgi:Terminase small subunit